MFGKARFTVLLTLLGFVPAALSEEVPGLLQGEDDRLAGVVRGIAYSGFRDGQHPDRGEGAVYPSDGEILEDLEIGNEALVTWNDHLVSHEAMRGYLIEVGERIQQSVTIADNYKVFSEKGWELGRYLDFAAGQTTFRV